MFLFAFRNFVPPAVAFSSLGAARAKRGHPLRGLHRDLSLTYPGLGMLPHTSG